MSAQFVQSAPLQPDQALKNARLGLLLWRIANGLVFVFFAFANYLMRSVHPSWPPPGVARLDVTVPLLITGVLLLSGVVAGRILPAMKHNDSTAAGRHILMTVGLGSLFLVGIIYICLTIPYSGPYSSIITVMNVFHALHVVIATVMFAYVFSKVQRGLYTKEKHWGVEGAVVFWHFVDVMWVFFFLVIYVL